MPASMTSSTPVQEAPADLLRQSAPEPTGEVVLLITCLHGPLFVVPHDTNWEILLGLANANGVLPLVYQSLHAIGTDMPDFFRDAALECAASARQLATDLEVLLDGLGEQGIEVLPLKGPALALALYGDATLRSSDDLDLLVRRDDFPRAEAFLLRQGFLALGALSEHDRRFLRGDLLVELHFELASPRYFPFRIDGIWSRSRPVDFRGRPARAMSKEDLVLYLCCHGLKHGFSRLIWILDVARALRGWQHRDYESLMLLAQRQDLEPWLLIGCEVVRAMFPQQLPEAMDAVIASSPKAAQRARYAVARLFSEDTQVVVNDYRSLYLQAEPSTLKQWRYRLRYLAPTYTDYQWARRHRINPGLMVIARPFRLLQKYGLGRVWRVLFPAKA